MPELNNLPINILVTLNEAYIPYLNVMLTSLLRSNPDNFFRVYLLHREVRSEALDTTRTLLWERGELIAVKIDDSRLSGAPTTSRYPTEIYYRIFAASFLPESVGRVLYLDPDLIVNKSLAEFYNMPMSDYLFAAASHVRGLIRKVNEYRLDMDESDPYINSGVMMNLTRLREVQDEGEVFNFIEEHRKTLILPDQDIISGLYGPDIIPLDPYRYNMTERLYAAQLLLGRKLTPEWVREHSAIIHYCGRNKPWKPGYIGQLDVFWHEAATLTDGRISPM